MKVLVFGGFGFVGKNLVSKLKFTEHETISFSRQNGVDLFDYKSLENCLVVNKPDVIVNCAAHVGSVNYVSKFPADIILNNVQMGLNLYRAVAKVCPKIKKIINPLANCAYPGNSEIQNESDWLAGEIHGSVFSYGNSKRIIYLISKCYETQIGINTINFLIPNTFGPGDSLDPIKTHALNGMIVRMIRAHNQNDKEFEVWGSGNPIREWTYIDDVVNLLIEGIESDKNLIEPLNLAQRKGYSIRQSAELIKNIIGYKGKLFYNKDYQDGARIKILDDRSFREIFPTFKFYNHEEGLKHTVEYYRNAIANEE